MSDIFFIISPPRSGSTLLRTILNNSSEVQMPHETPLIYNLLNFFNSDAPKSNSILIRSILKTKNFSEVFNLSQKQLLSLDLSTNLSILDIIVKIYSMNSSGKKFICGDKYVGNSLIIDELNHNFPSAKFIFIERNSLDSIYSIKKNFFGYTDLFNRFYFTNHYFDASLLWSLYNFNIRISKNKIDNKQTFTLKYEDFVEKPHYNLEAICKFLGIRFDRKMVDLIGDKNFRQESLPFNRYESLHKNILNPISTKYIGIGSKNVPNKYKGLVFKFHKDLFHGEAPSKIMGLFPKVKILRNFVSVPFVFKRLMQ